jgi:hypothetical protein
MKQRVSFIEHRGKRICYHDFAHIMTIEEALDAIRQSAEVVRKEPAGSVLTLTNVEGSRFNREVVEALKKLMEGNKPFVKAGAIVGLSGIQRVVYVAVTQFTGRRLPTFTSLEEAKDHLAAIA